MPYPTILNAHLWTWLKARWIPRKALPPEWQRATDLIEALNNGGVPLNPARVNDIARKLGLEVSTKAPLEQTISRIRAALADRACGQRNCSSSAP